jgi:hypothetical protein
LCVEVKQRALGVAHYSNDYAMPPDCIAKYEPMRERMNLGVTGLWWPVGRILGSGLQPVAWLCLLLALCLSPMVAQAQAAKGYTGVIADVLPGRNLTLPFGQWQLVAETTVQPLGLPWRTWVLLNTDDDALMPMLVVRVSQNPVRWHSTPCDSINATNFAVDRHGTLGVDPVGKCTTWAELSPWSTARQTIATNAWWTPVVEASHGLKIHPLESVVLLDVALRRPSEHGVHLQAFVRTEPVGKKAADLAREYRMSAQLSSVHQWLDALSKAMVAGIDDSFYLRRASRSPDVLALARSRGLTPDFSLVSAAENSSGIHEALRQAAAEGEAELALVSKNPDHPLHPARWGWHTSSNSFILIRPHKD